MSIFPAGYLNSHKDDADDAIDIELTLYFIEFQNNICVHFVLMLMFIEGKTC
jgi:hypothetical protein